MWLVTPLYLNVTETEVANFKCSNMMGFTVLGFHRGGEGGWGEQEEFQPTTQNLWPTIFFC